MSDRTIRIAVQSKGRLHDGSLELLKDIGIELPVIAERSLMVKATNAPIEVVFVRHSDVPRYVESGVISYGIVGANILHEQEPAVTTLKRFDFGYCKLVIATPTDSHITAIEHLSGHRIATAYPNSLRKFLRKHHLAAAVVGLTGSIEITTTLDLADAICDLTQTGNTLRAHNLTSIHTVLESTAALIMSPHYQPKANELLYKALTEKI